MKYDPTKHHRRSIRLKEYDYTQPGAYFVTLVAYKRMYLFGQITDGIMNLNGFGKIAESCWHEIPDHFPNVQLDEFIVMPNHIHGIIIITDKSRRGKACLAQTAPQSKVSRGNASRGNECVVPTKPIPGSLGVIIGSYKSAISKRINELRKTPGEKVWHRNYYESIARNEFALNRIRQYIISNPYNWNDDEENR